MDKVEPVVCDPLRPASDNCHTFLKDEGKRIMDETGELPCS